MGPRGGELHLSVSRMCVCCCGECTARSLLHTCLVSLGETDQRWGGFHCVACIKKIASFSQVSNEPGIGENGSVSREFGCSEVEHREREGQEVCAKGARSGEERKV
jgi:hypothetical protein